MEENPRRGKLIVIEGSDGSGKKTQTKLLIERARQYGVKVGTISFPQYETPTGQRVKEYLRGKFGPLDQVDPKFAARLYAEDRLEAKPLLLKWLSGGVNIILDRYIESNMAHQGGKFKGKERDEMIQWIYDLEINQLDLPKSDLVIYLDLPVEWQVKAMDKEGRDKDLHESSIQHLLDAEETYKMLAEQNKNWVKINCLRDGRRLSPEELSYVIWKVVEPMLVK